MANDPDAKTSEQIEQPEEDPKKSTDQTAVEKLDAGDASTTDDGSTSMPPPNPKPPNG